jgi:hypothetical protein
MMKDLRSLTTHASRIENDEPRQCTARRFDPHKTCCASSRNSDGLRWAHVDARTAVTAGIFIDYCLAILDRDRVQRADLDAFALAFTFLCINFRYHGISLCENPESTPGAPMGRTRTHAA